MTEQELRDSVGLHFDDVNKKIYYYPKDIIDQSYKADSYDVDGFTRGAPTGRYLAPANSGGCYAVVSGDCVNRHLYFRGPRFMRFDLSLVKRIRFTEKKNFELRGEFLNAFNHVNFYGTAGIGRPEQRPGHLGLHGFEPAAGSWRPADPDRDALQLLANPSGEGRGIAVSLLSSCFFKPRNTQFYLQIVAATRGITPRRQVRRSS